ncbi:MAG: hypothetical protein M3082_08165 [Candidatus Dormibacteraeota bacterium]|nr:hypothetical protein [Candidatus Dormibacteraeota bacterium]
MKALIGQAERLEQGRTELGPRFADEMFRIHPHRIQSVGLDGDQPSQDIEPRSV